MTFLRLRHPHLQHHLPEPSGKTFAPVEDELRWLHMTGFLLQHLDTPVDLLADAIAAEIMLGDDPSDPPVWSAAGDQRHEIRLYGITGSGISIEDCAASWRARAHTAVAAFCRKAGA